VLPELDVLLRVALALTRNHADAEDLVQDTLLRAYRAIERFDGEHPRAWLLTILRNANINRNRRQRPSLLADPQSALAKLASTADGSDDPERLVVDERFDGAVAAAFGALPERFRRVVELVDIDGLSYEEAATVLSIPVGTVMSRLHRARARMKRQLTSAGYTRRGSR
jgi:RNA polymerase sigma-70 factor (ECF subfamily)